jgi:DNA helicase HerA-like ATPase
VGVSIIDLSGLPSEIADVVVSLACRVIFDFVLWSRPGQVPPLLLVCEEAHRYVPANEETGFAAAARAITRISKEGRKYGISLGLISQRPTELSQAALSQCGTIFALRMGSELDQRFVATALPDAAQGMLAALPMLRNQEAIISGEGVSLPMRVRFDDLPPTAGRAARAPSSRRHGGPVAIRVRRAPPIWLRRACSAGVSAPVCARHSELTMHVRLRGRRYSHPKRESQTVIR